MTKFKIDIIYTFSARSAAKASSLKKQLKAKVPRIAFSRTSKNGTMFSFQGKLSYTKSLQATKKQVVVTMRKIVGNKAAIRVSIVK